MVQAVQDTHQDHQRENCLASISPRVSLQFSDKAICMVFTDNFKQTNLHNKNLSNYISTKI